LWPILKLKGSQLKLISQCFRLFALLLLHTFSIPEAVAAALQHEWIAASPEVYAEPHDLVLSPDGKHLYVADNGNDRVAVLDPMTLALLGELGKGELSQPHDVAFDPLGRLLMADTGNDRSAIYRIEGLKGRLVGALKQGLRRPEGVAAHPDGRMVVADKYSHRIQVIAPGGPLRQVIGEGKAGKGPGRFDRPEGVAIRGQDIWFSDTYNDRIVRYRLVNEK